MPVQTGAVKPEGRASVPAGFYVMTISEIAEEEAPPQWGQKEQYKIFLMTDGGVELRTWVSKSFWGGDPQPSKLYVLMRSMGYKSDEAPQAQDVNALIGKKVGVEVIDKTTDKGTFSRIKNFMSPRIAEAYAKKDFEEQADDSVK